MKQIAFFLFIFVSLWNKIRLKQDVKSLLFAAIVFDLKLINMNYVTQPSMEKLSLVLTVEN